MIFTQGEAPQQTADAVKACLDGSNTEASDTSFMDIPIQSIVAAFTAVKDSNRDKYSLFLFYNKDNKVEYHQSLPQNLDIILNMVDTLLMKLGTRRDEFGVKRNHDSVLIFTPSILEELAQLTSNQYFTSVAFPTLSVPIITGFDMGYVVTNVMRDASIVDGIKVEDVIAITSNQIVTKDGNSVDIDTSQYYKWTVRFPLYSTRSEFAEVGSDTNTRMKRSFLNKSIKVSSKNDVVSFWDKESNVRFDLKYSTLENATRVARTVFQKKCDLHTTNFEFDF